LENDRVPCRPVFECLADFPERVRQVCSEKAPRSSIGGGTITKVSSVNRRPVIHRSCLPRPVFIDERLQARFLDRRASRIPFVLTQPLIHRYDRHGRRVTPCGSAEKSRTVLH